jgi:Spy/CpxP family protein refolding chaperone
LRNLVVVLAIITFSFEITIAQESNAKRNRGLPDSLFSPQLIIDSQEEIGLTPEQLKKIEDLSMQLSKETQSVGQQMKLESEKLSKLLSASAVDEADATVIIYRIMDLERQLRIDEILYLIKLKNVLSETQQKQLSEIRSEQVF